MRAPLTAAGVLAAHIAAVGWLAGAAPANGGGENAARPSGTPLTVFFVQDRDLWDAVPAPEIQLRSPPLELTALQAVRFDDPDDNIWGVISSASAPRPAAYQSVDTSAFAQRAGLAAKASASVVLEVEILPDGEVGAVGIFASSGQPRIDIAAVEYARSLRWIPATRDHKAIAARIRFPVLLIRAA